MIIHDNMEVYECDPEKNIPCRKTNCYMRGGECHQTFKKKFAKMQVKYIEQVEAIDIVNKAKIRLMEMTPPYKARDTYNLLKEIETEILNCHTKEVTYKRENKDAVDALCYISGIGEQK